MEGGYLGDGFGGDVLAVLPVDGGSLSPDGFFLFGGDLLVENELLLEGGVGEPLVLGEGELDGEVLD